MGRNKQIEKWHLVPPLPLALALWLRSHRAEFSCGLQMQPLPSLWQCALLWAHHGPEHLVLMSGNSVFIAPSILDERSDYRHPSMLPQEFLKRLSSRDLGESMTKADFDFKPRFAAFVNS